MAAMIVLWMTGSLAAAAFFFWIAYASDKEYREKAKLFFDSRKRTPHKRGYSRAQTWHREQMRKELAKLRGTKTAAKETLKYGQVAFLSLVVSIVFLIVFR